MKQNTSEKALGIFGEQTVNVLKLNIDLVSEMKK
ncbi:MAG: potassium-transporting ATPase subunit C [Anaerococcus sp.]|nr:potassium-transporting ATPase subunit C [Anaerococcus sp.]